MLNYIGLEWTKNDNLGTSWEKLFFSWEFLGTFSINNQ